MTCFTLSPYIYIISIVPLWLDWTVFTHIRILIFCSFLFKIVAMVIEIGFSMRFFLIIMATLLFGVSQSFWLMYNYNDTNEIGWTLFRSFTATLGDFDTDFAGSANPMLTLSLLVCFLMFMVRGTSFIGINPQ